MRAFVLLALVACAHASSSYASGSSTTAAASPSATASSATAASSAFGSGSTSAAASSAKAPAPAPAPKGNSTAPAPGPAPAPAPQHRIVSAIKLTGVTVAMFDARTKAGMAGRTAFQKTVAGSMDGVTYKNVFITGVKAGRRAGVAIDFYVNVKDANAATAGATKLNTALEAKAGAGSFASKLIDQAQKAGATDLAKVKPADITTTVTKKPEAKVINPTPAPTAVASAPATAVVSMASVAFAALALC